MCLSSLCVCVHISQEGLDIFPCKKSAKFLVLLSEALASEAIHTQLGAIAAPNPRGQAVPCPQWQEVVESSCDIVNFVDVQYLLLKCL